MSDEGRKKSEKLDNMCKKYNEKSLYMLNFNKLKIF
jgi:hypothetical protein